MNEKGSLTLEALLCLLPFLALLAACALSLWQGTDHCLRRFHAFQRERERLVQR